MESKVKYLIKIALMATVLSVLALACAPARETPIPTAPPVVRGTATVQKPAWEQKWDSALAQAKKEGELTIYTTLSGDVLRKIVASFSDKYGIQGNVISARGPELMQRMDTQRRAGLNLADAVIAGGTNLVVLMKPQGYLDKIDAALILPEVVDGKAWRGGGLNYFDKDHYGVGMVSSLVRQVIMNTNLVKGGEISSYKDILKPRCKGKIVMNDPTIAGAGNSFVSVLAQIFGPAETREFLKQLAAQDLTVTRDNRQLVEWVSRGKNELGLGSQGEQVGEFVRMGAPIAPVKTVEGGMVTSMAGGIGIVNNRPHPNAAVVFVNWLLSREGHAVFVKQSGLPGARIDSPTEGISPIFYPDPGEKFFIATEETWQLQSEMLKVAAEVFAPVLK